MHTAGAYILDEDGTRYYSAYCTFCQWQGTKTLSHKLAAEEAVEHSDTAVLLKTYQDTKFSYPDATWEQVFSLEEVED